MTRAKDISKIVTDADLSGTLDVTGTVTANELVVSQETPKITITDTGTGSDHELNGASSIGNLTLNFDKNDDGSSPYFYIQHASTKLAAFRKGGDISFYEDTGTTPKLFWDASAERLGVGTSSPSHELTVAGSADTRVTIDGSNSAGLYISDSGANGITIRNTNDGDLEFLTVGGKEVVFNQLSVDTDFRVESDNNTHALFVQGSNGNVGLGLTAPSRKLSIYDATNPYIALYDGSSGTAIADGFQVQFASTNAYLWNYENGFTAFGTNASERMRITSGGNVGIGTTTINAPLVVNKAQNNNNAQLMNSSAGGYGLYSKGGGGGSGLYTARFDNYAGTERMRIDNSGNVGIGTTSMTELFEIHGDTPSIKLRDTSAYSAGTGPAISFQGKDNAESIREFGRIEGISRSTDNGELAFSTRLSGTVAERVRIDQSGNVGIGNSNPSDFGSLVDNLVIGTTSGENGMTIASGTANSGRIQFSDNTSSPFVGAFEYSHSSNEMYVYTNGSQRTRVQANGAFQVKVNNASYHTWSNNTDACQINSDISNKVTFTVNAQTTTFANDVQRLLCDRTANSAYDFLTCTSGNLGDDEFKLRGDGQAYADGSWNGGGADYAEYFEWSDGNTDSEDRRGYTVVLDNNKIRKATSDDDASIIIGVISGNPSMVGDSDISQWKHKYQRDDYGTYVLDENGDRVLNTDYDETQEYVSRENRQEWDTVGLMGKLRIRKNQPTGSNWIKMRDVSETVEEWLVR
jgi:hypothetical protein